MAKVITIPATKAADLKQPDRLRTRKVAAYARVSTGSDEQATSFAAQVDYYTRHIQTHEGWEFVAVYTDEGISGTSTKKREGFKAMIADALSGKIDLIITKSISRFARNTVDTLTAIRELRAKKVEVHFEKENIWTLDGKGELLLTIMSSLAQEESRSISENVTWGIRKRFAEGKVSAPFKAFLGYDKDFKINEEQAKTVRYIFKQFLQGDDPTTIARKLRQSGVKTATGKTGWKKQQVMYILTNEKYKGAALLQKRYSVDFLTKKRAVNTGELPRYYIPNHHEAIIEPAAFDKAQKMLGLEVI